MDKKETIKWRMEKRKIIAEVARKWGLSFKESFPLSTFDFYLFRPPGSVLAAAVKVLEWDIVEQVAYISLPDFRVISKFPLPVYGLTEDILGISWVDLKKNGVMEQADRHSEMIVSSEYFKRIGEVPGKSNEG